MSQKSRDLHHMTISGFVDAIRKVYKLEKMVNIDLSCSNLTCSMETSNLTEGNVFIMKSKSHQPVDRNLVMISQVFMTS